MSAYSTPPDGAQLGLVVPLYDEARHFDRCAPELASFAASEPGGVDLVFVDDGSADETAALVEKLIREHPEVSIRLIRRPHEGKGAALAAGLGSLTTPVAAFCDFDLATPLADLRRIVRAARSAPVLAIGSRDLADSVLERPEHPARELLGRAFNRVLQATITPGVVDTQCGAKAARADVWSEVLGRCREPGFAWDAEVVAICLRRGIPIREVPVTWRHDEDSKVRVVNDGLAMLVAVRRIRRRVHAMARVPRYQDGDRGIFDDGRALELMDSGRDHWWFRSKAAFVATALRRTGTRTATGREDRLVDVGAGPGAVTAMIGRDPLSMTVVEGNPGLARFARSHEGLLAAAGTVDAVPIATGAAGVVCLLDVIEHLEDPTGALAEVHRVLGPGGRLVVNVPAHRWLWSAADEHLGHHRRYTRHMLRRALIDADFDVVLCTHVFSWLVPPVWLRRRLARRDEPQLGLDAVGGPIDVAASVLTFGERQLIGRVELPFGTSILAVARCR